MEKRDQILESLVPTPIALQYERKDENSIMLSWENVIPMLSCIEGNTLYKTYYDICGSHGHLYNFIVLMPE